jgi:hypothetical protein
MKLTTHLHLVPRLKIHGAFISIPPTQIHAAGLGTEANLFYLINSIFILPQNVNRQEVEEICALKQ